jgi:type IV pilus assembly protein PilC
MQRGHAEADSERDLIFRLRNQGYLVLQVERDRDLQAMMQRQGGLFARKISGKELAIFIRQFATMINAGLPVVTALRVLSKQTANPRLQRVLVQITADVEAGEDLATAFGRHPDAFPVIMIQMISAGEVGGILDDVCVRLADQLEKQEEIRQKVRSAMVYPSIVTCVAILVVIFLMIFVVPKFVDVYSDFGADLPLPTKILIGTSDLVRRLWWGFGVGAVATYLGLRSWLRTEQGLLFRDRFVLKLPVFGPMVARESIARFARTLSGLLASGITILKALAVVERTVGNRVIGAAVRVAAEDVRQGQSLVAPLRKSGVFPPMVLEMTSVGEETGTVEEMLDKVADFYESEVERTAERLSATLEPLIILGLAMTVGAIVASMMLPIFNLWTVIG